MTSLLLVPAIGLAWLAYRQDWTGFKPFALTILVTALYVVVATVIRAVSEPGSNKEPSLLEQIEALENPHTCACGDVSGHPNNVYGWGEINALAAVKLALKQE